MISTMREYFRGLKFVLLLVIVAFVATSVVYFGSGSMRSAQEIEIRGKPVLMVLRSKSEVGAFCPIGIGVTVAFPMWLDG